MKYVYITGADRGLGLGLTKKFLSEDYTVFAGQYLPEWPELDELKQEVGDRLIIVPLDISNDESVQRATEIIQGHTDVLDVLINNAAIAQDLSGDILGRLDFEAMKNQYNVNSLGTLRVTHSVIQMIIDGNEKRVVNISSEAGSIADNWRAKGYGYNMSKSAVNMQSAILQFHMKEFGVKVYAFHPGWVQSYMSGKKNTEGTESPEVSAEGIYEQMQKYPNIDDQMYMDWTGKPLPY